MTEFSTNPKCIRAMAKKDRMIDIDSQRRERKGYVVLANIGFKLQTMGTCSIKEISELSWSRREWRKINLASETTRSKFWFIHRRL